MLVDPLSLMSRLLPNRVKVWVGLRQSETDSGSEYFRRFSDICVKAGGDKLTPILATVSLWYPPGPWKGRVTVNDAEFTRQLTITKRTQVDKPIANYKILDIYGPNILSTTGGEWLKHRTLCNPSFSENNNRMVVTTTVALCDALFTKWDRNLATANSAYTSFTSSASSTASTSPSSKENISHDTTALTLGVIGTAGFGEDMSDLFKKNTTQQDIGIPEGDIRNVTPSLRQCMHVLSLHTLRRLLLPKFVFALPFTTKHNRWLGKCFDQFEVHLRRLIDKAAEDIKNNQARADVLTLLVRAHFGVQKTDEGQGGMNAVDETDADSRDSFAGVAKAGSKLSLQEVIADSYVFFFAGHETTAHSLAFALALLALHPEQQARLHAEVKDAIGNELPTYDDVSKLIYARCVALESLRKFPPVASIPKCTMEGVTLTTLSGDVTVPPKTNIALNVYALHHNPRYWTEPDKFKPERFDTRGASPPEPSHKSAFLPFSQGQRSCIGKTFAELELTVALARMAQCFTFSVPSGVSAEQLTQWKAVLTTCPVRDIELIVSRRN